MTLSLEYAAMGSFTMCDTYIWHKLKWDWSSNLINHLQIPFLGQSRRAIFFPSLAIVCIGKMGLGVTFVFASSYL